MSAIFSFAVTLYLKEQTNIFWCFSRLIFENRLFSNKPYRCIFWSKRAIYTAEKEKIKYFVHRFVQITLSLCCCCCCHKLRIFNFLESFKILLSPLREFQVLEMYYTMKDCYIKLNQSSKYKKCRNHVTFLDF